MAATNLNSIAVNEIIFSNHNTPMTNTVSGMMFVSGAELMINLSGATLTVTTS